MPAAFRLGRDGVADPDLPRFLGQQQTKNPSLIPESIRPLSVEGEAAGALGHEPHPRSMLEELTRALDDACRAGRSANHHRFYGCAVDHQRRRHSSA